MEKLKLEPRLKFSDVVSSMSCIKDVAFCPMLDSMTDLESIEEARAKVSVLANIFFYGCFVVVPCEINGSTFIFFYSPIDGESSYRKVYSTKISDLTIFKHEDLHVATLLADELDVLFDPVSTVRDYLAMEDSICDKQRIIIILNANILEDEQSVYRRLTYIFPNLDAVLFIDKGHTNVMKHERAMVLC